MVCITTPSGSHLEPALAAIRAGKHLVIEKPIEITTARTDEILQAADAAGVRIVPIFQSRFGEGARTVKAAIDAGRLGRLVLASNYVKWHRTAHYYTPPRGLYANDGGGAVINQAIHGLDLLQWFVGLPAEVFAWKTRRVYTHIEVEDTAVASLKYANGALGAFEASTALWPGWSRRHEICGEHGSIALEDDRITHWEFRDGTAGDDAIRGRRQNQRPRLRRRRARRDFRRGPPPPAPGYGRRPARGPRPRARRPRRPQSRRLRQRDSRFCARGVPVKL